MRYATLRYAMLQQKYGSVDGRPSPHVHIGARIAQGHATKRT